MYLMEKSVRSDKSQKILISGGIIIILILGGIAYAIAQNNLIPAFIAASVPLVVFSLVIFYRYPVSLLYLLLIYGILITIFERYIGIPSAGLGVDFTIVLSLLIIFFKSFSFKFPWYRLRIPLIFILFVWIIYCVLEIFNTNANSIVPWFVAIRTYGIYMLFIPFAMLFINKMEHLKWFLYIWFILTVSATLYGCIQKYMGPNTIEHAVLAAGMGRNHYVFGNLRIFSFLNDAGIFGASQAHVGISSLLIALAEKKPLNKCFFLLTAICGLYGMAVSGTRGSLFIPFAGILFFFFLKKNIKVLILGGIIVGIIFFGLKYTYIGQSNFTVRRMRSAFNLEDASFQVRLANQQKLREYLKTRPFGEGLGSTGESNQQYSPNSVVANTPPDSGYVAIWAQTGIIGLILYLGLWFYIVGKGCFIIWGLRDTCLKGIMTALLCGIVGLLVANYGNSVIARQTVEFVVYFSIAFIFLSPVLEKQMEEQAA